MINFVVSMNKRIVVIGSIVVIVAIGFLALNYGYSAKDGSKAPEINTLLVDGRPFRLSDLEGKYVLLDFWGSWCGPCLKEIPDLIELNNDYSDKLIIVSIGLEKNDKTWRKVVNKFKLPWKHQIIEVSPIVLASKTARKYGVTEIPVKFLIGPDGKFLGEYSVKKIDSLLGSQLLSKN